LEGGISLQQEGVVYAVELTRAKYTQDIPRQVLQILFEYGVDHCGEVLGFQAVLLLVCRRKVEPHSGHQEECALHRPV
jgi:hypothetical protein